MGWFGAFGQFAGSAAAAFIETLAKLEKKELIESKDYCSDETKQFISLGIDCNTKPTKRVICIMTFKTTAKCICSGYNVDDIRAVTYSYLTLR